MSGPRPGTAGLVLRRTRSQEIEYSSGVSLSSSIQPVAAPFAAYPPDISAVQQLGQQVQQAVEMQSSRLDDVQQAVGAQQQFTYEQLMTLHQKQQEQQQQQMAFNDKLMAELQDQRKHQQLLVEQLMAQKQVAEAHERGLHMVAESSVKHEQQLEEMRRRTSARWHAFSAPPSEATPGVGVPPPSVQVVYGFHEVTKAPTFNGSTKVEIRTFMDQYEAYSREIASANAQRPGGAKIHQVSLSACIDPLSVERIAFWEIGKPSHELTEEDWRVYFLSAKDCDPVDMGKLDQAMGKLRMDVSIQSAESRVSKLVSDFESILVKLSMEGFAEAEPKLTVEYLVAAIAPTSVRSRVKDLLKLYEHRGLKKDARLFKAWLSDYMRRYGEFEPLIAKASAGGDKPKETNPQVKRSDKKAKVVAVANVDKVPVSNFTQDKRVCFKCLSPDHNVFKCPKVVDGEAKLLMEKARAVWRELADKPADKIASKPAKAVNVVKCQSVDNWDLAVGCAARVVCVAGRTVTLAASFDSGADQSVVPPKTLAKLRSEGRDIKVVKLSEPVLVKGFTGPAHSVTEEAVLQLRFETEAGPLVLSNVKCWVTDDDLPESVGDILLSRAIMCKLGFDPRSMLRDAASIASEYDMAGATSPSGVVSAIMLARQEMEDDLSMEEQELLPLEMDVCFPDVQADLDEEKTKVQSVLKEKIAEALASGCTAEFALKLEALLER
ncbi:unnamed protein product, partial [Aphanomyces euteiches]